MAFDVGVGVGIEGFGELDVKAIVPDFDRTSWGCGGVIAHGDVFADERGVDLVDGAVQTQCSVFLDPVFGLEEEQLVEVEGGLWVSDFVGRLCPALEWSLAIESAMRGVMVLAFDKGPEFAVEGFEGGGVIGAEVSQQLGANGSEPALDVSFSLWLVRTCVD